MNAQDARDLEKWAAVVDGNINTIAECVGDLDDRLRNLEARSDRQHKLIEMLVDTLKEIAK